MNSLYSNAISHTDISSLLSPAWQFWIDQVGTVRIHESHMLEIGGPAQPSSANRLSLMADLEQKHAVIIRTESGYLIEPWGDLFSEERKITGTEPLYNGQEIQLGDPLGNGVVLRLRMPSVLTQTAVIDFISTHRPEPRIDSLILMEEMCFIGNQTDCHIRTYETKPIYAQNVAQKTVPDTAQNTDSCQLEETALLTESATPTEERIVLFRDKFRNREQDQTSEQSESSAVNLLCKTIQTTNNIQTSKTSTLTSGDVFEGTQFQFRVESY